MAMEFQALQIMSARTYGILVTLEPAVGPIVRAWFRGQAFSRRGLVATGGVTIADIGITVFDKPDAN